MRMLSAFLNLLVLLGVFLLPLTVAYQGHNPTEKVIINMPVCFQRENMRSLIDATVDSEEEEAATLFVLLITAGECLPMRILVPIVADENFFEYYRMNGDVLIGSLPITLNNGLPAFALVRYSVDHDGTIRPVEEA